MVDFLKSFVDLLSRSATKAKKHGWFLIPQVGEQDPLSPSAFSSSLGLHDPYWVPLDVVQFSKDDPWEVFREKSIIQLKNDLTYADDPRMKPKIKNFEALLKYYESEAKDFAPERLVWVCDGCVHLKEPTSYTSELWVQEQSKGSKPKSGGKYELCFPKSSPHISSWYLVEQ